MHDALFQVFVGSVFRQNPELPQFVQSIPRLIFGQTAALRQTERVMECFQELAWHVVATSKLLKLREQLQPKLV